MNLCLYQKLDINGHTIFFFKEIQERFFKSQFFTQSSFTKACVYKM